MRRQHKSVSRIPTPHVYLVLAFIPSGSICRRSSVQHASKQAFSCLATTLEDPEVPSGDTSRRPTPRGHTKWKYLRLFNLALAISFYVTLPRSVPLPPPKGLPLPATLADRSGTRVRCSASVLWQSALLAGCPRELGDDVILKGPLYW